MDNVWKCARLLTMVLAAATAAPSGEAFGSEPVHCCESTVHGGSAIAARANNASGLPVSPAFWLLANSGPRPVPGRERNVRAFVLDE